MSQLKRKRSNDIQSLWQDHLEVFEQGFVTYRDETIEKWNAKVQVANGIPLQKKFKAINQSLLSQIKNLLSDKERLVKRTRLKRGQYSVLGKIDDPIEENGLDKHLNDYDDEIFDDGDYYQLLLKELIESRMNDSEDPIQLAIKFAQLKNLQKQKNKKIVDTKASKGRKIRYQVQEKIQNFMASEPRGTWHDERVQELFSNLLGLSSEVQEDSMPEITDGFKLM